MGYDKEKQKQWRREHPEKVKIYRQNYLIKKYLADIIASRTGKAAPEPAIKNG